MRTLNGVYRALVTDTSCFEETGKIKTKISIFNNFYVENNLLDGYSADKHKESISRDRLTSIMTPYGGGYNCGMFALPQMNSQGLVSFIDGDPELPIWIGSVNLSKTSGDFLEYSDVPSDNLFQEKSSVDFDALKKETKKTYKNKNSFIIRTKTNELDQNDLTDYNKINWEVNQTENGLIMNKENLQLIHKHDSNSFNGLIMNNDENYSVELSHKIIDDDFLDEDGNIDEESVIEKSSILLGKSGVIISNKENEKEITIEANNKIRLFLKKDNQTTEIYQDENTIRLINADCVIEMKQLASGLNEINISAPKVRIDSKEIFLGAGDNRIVTSTSDFTMTLEDGTILNSAKNVRL